MNRSNAIPETGAFWLEEEVMFVNLISAHRISLSQICLITSGSLQTVNCLGVRWQDPPLTLQCMKDLLAFTLNLPPDR